MLPVNFEGSNKVYGKPKGVIVRMIDIPVALVILFPDDTHGTNPILRIVVPHVEKGIQAFGHSIANDIVESRCFKPHIIAHANKDGEIWYTVQRPVDRMDFASTRSPLHNHHGIA